jgi:NAD(P)-dependent dehydrogenase (short-subunit alcohol dehydrogenase family)
MSSKVAIVTGASQGIGRSTAIRLARDFDSIVLVAGNRANLEETATEVKKAGAHWAPLHNMSVEEATAKFSVEAGIARYGTPEEIAKLMAFVVSPAARWMTGSTLRMDGGEVKSI